LKIFKKGVIKKYKPLYILSYDSSKTKKVSLCNYKNKFLSGDDLKNNSIPSVDMIFLHKKNKIVCFVEFKNSPYSNLDNWKYKKQFREKIFGSRILLSENLNIDIRNFKKIYFVIYNKVVSSYVEEFENWANIEKNIEFNLLELVEKDFINEVFTENCEFLKSFFQEKFNITFI